MQVLSAIESHAFRSNVVVLASPNVHMQSVTFAHRDQVATGVVANVEFRRTQGATNPMRVSASLLPNTLEKTTSTRLRVLVG